MRINQQMVTGCLIEQQCPSVGHCDGPDDPQFICLNKQMNKYTNRKTYLFQTSGHRALTNLRGPIYACRYSMLSPSLYPKTSLIRPLVT